MDLTSYRTLGRSGLVVSPLALGTITFGTPRWGTADDVSEAVFDAYVGAGGNFVDTADVYAGGRSEELVGGLVADRSLRDRIVSPLSSGSAAGPETRTPGGTGEEYLPRARRLAAAAEDRLHA